MTRKKLLILLGSVCLALVLAIPLVASCGPAPSPSPTPSPTPTLTPTPTPTSAPTPTEKVYEWRQQRYGGSEYDPLYEAFEDNVSTMSGGRMQVMTFRGSEIVPNDMILKAVSDGTLEMACGFGAYWPGTIDVGIIEAGVPTAWSSYGEALYFWYGKGFDDLVREAYAEQNVHYICPEFGGPYELLTKVPVNSLDDMKKLKIRATATVVAILEKLGIATVYLPPEEIYLALSTGTIDGVIYGGAFDYKLLKLNEVATYYTKISLLRPGYVDDHLVNMDAWNALPEDLQKIVELACLEEARQFHIFVETGNYAVLGEGLFTVGAIPSADAARLVAAAQEVWDDEAAKSPRNAKAIEMLRDMARALGRLT